MANQIRPKIAWTMIIKADNPADAPTLQKALGSINGYVDEIFLQLNVPKGKKIAPEIRKVAERFTDKIYEYEWRNNFVAARNDIFAKVPKEFDWIGWSDLDDLIESPEMIVPSLAIMPKDVNGVYILYDYQKDEYGNVIVSHWTSRAVRNNGSHIWKSSIDDDEVSVHETLVPKRSSAGVSNNEWKVIHNAPPEHHRDSLLRNITLLEGMAARQAQKPEGIDPRILFYLGTHYYDAYRFKEAKECFYEYLKMSGWAEERSEAHTYMGKLLLMEGNISGARTAFLMAMGEYPNNNGPYLELAKLESKSQRWEQAAEWAKRGLEIEQKTTTMVKYNNEFDLLTQYAQSLSNLGGKSLTKALETAQKALKLRPYDPDAIANRDALKKVVTYRNELRAIARVLGILKEAGKTTKIIPFLDLLPLTYADSPVIIGARQQYTEGKKWPKKSIAIYAGHGPLGEWGPWSINEGGTGGSEEAIIRLSKELVELGWKVTVYATPGMKAGTYDGVEWKHYWELNQKDTFDVLISWRQPGFFDVDFKARKKYLWLHDVVEKDELTPERLKEITKIIYVSKYHSEREESDHVPLYKKLASGNGITPADFNALERKSIKRNPKRCIYMSANERGLRILYEIWEDVIKEVPDAELVTYYGWQSFDAVNRDNPERMAWKASMQLRAKELGIEDSKRIDHNKINEEIFKSGIWAYPSFFPEVNCITAQKAQAGGAWPVTSTFAALNDVVLYGDKIDMGDFTPEDIEKYKKALIHRLKNPPTEKERQKMMAEARKKFDWKVTASQWSEEMK